MNKTEFNKGRKIYYDEYGYPRYLELNGLRYLCMDCSNKNAQIILKAISDKSLSNWKPVDFIEHDFNWEDDVYCDHCGNAIETSLYGK